MTREEKINELAQSCEDWDIDSLVAYAYSSLETYFQGLSDEELDYEYESYREGL